MPTVFYSDKYPTLAFFRSEKLAKIGVPHAFTTRFGGVSTGDFDSLNVSTRRKDRNGEFDAYENTVENFWRVTSLVNATPENSVCAHQVHGNRILRLDESHKGMGILKSAIKNEDADGLFLPSRDSGIEAICVKSADCTPILFADAENGSVCAVHSGWRGTVADIPGKAVETMIMSGSKKENIFAAIGPCIGSCCYEVSEDVYIEAEKTFTEKGVPLPKNLFTHRTETPEGVKYHFNMVEMCKSLITLSGVPKENIDVLNLCTCCFENENGRVFFSHRGQNGYSGTFATVISAK